MSDNTKRVPESKLKPQTNLNSEKADLSEYIQSSLFNMESRRPKYKREQVSP